MMVAWSVTMDAKAIPILKPCQLSWPEMKQKQDFWRTILFIQFNQYVAIQPSLSS